MYIPNPDLNDSILERVEEARIRISQGLKFNGTIYGKKTGSTRIILSIYLSGTEFTLGEIERDQEKDTKNAILWDLNRAKPDAAPENNMLDSLKLQRDFNKKEAYLDYKITDLLSINLSDFVETGNPFMQADLEQMQECARNLQVTIYVDHTFKNGLTLQIATVESSNNKKILLLKKRAGEHKKILDVLPEHLEKLIADVKRKIQEEQNS